jgi:hypothetical protein
MTLSSTNWHLLSDSGPDELELFLSALAASTATAEWDEEWEEEQEGEFAPTLAHTSIATD